MWVRWKSRNQQNPNSSTYFCLSAWVTKRDIFLSWKYPRVWHCVTSQGYLSIAFSCWRGLLVYKQISVEMRKSKIHKVSISDDVNQINKIRDKGYQHGKATVFFGFIFTNIIRNEKTNRGWAVPSSAQAGFKLIVFISNPTYVMLESTKLWLSWNCDGVVTSYF